VVNLLFVICKDFKLLSLPNPSGNLFKLLLFLQTDHREVTLERVDGEVLFFFKTRMFRMFLSLAGGMAILPTIAWS
jgi:hypothetical protein